MMWKFMTMTETLFALPATTTLELLDYLLNYPVESLPDEVVNNYWFYLDYALGYQFWADKQDELCQLQENS